MSLGTVTQAANAYDYTLTSTGVGIGTTDDNWACANCTINVVSAAVICQIGTVTPPPNNLSSVVGICIRDGTTTAGASQARAIYLQAAQTSLTSSLRSTAGGSLVSVASAMLGWSSNPYLKITRTSQTAFSFFYSTDSNNWIALGTASMPGMPQLIYIQLYAGTGTPGTVPVTVVFKQVNIQQLAPINYTFSGLVHATNYVITAVSEDIALNNAVASAPVTLSTA